ncbi:hypothetical protein H2203_002163 [Taxawa tesnikishii (nom. ined.)]|nr:hypothetical protein H2203_002163 [Dothideales sp. JES 119]
MATSPRALFALVIITGISLASLYKFLYPSLEVQSVVPTNMAPASSCVQDFDYGFPIAAVESQARRLNTHSWENGTLAEALLELHDPDLSVFSRHAFPADKIPSASLLENATALAYAKPHIQLDSETLIDDKWGVSDPAALGVAAVMLGQIDSSYLKAAERQKRYLLETAPRYKNGAISHRKEVEELWSDAVHMVPPFLAYYAVVSNDLDAMKQAVEQCRLYRDVLVVKEEGREKGLWRHIVGPSEKQDLNFWSTGNGWAAMGMTRVLAAIVHWKPASWLEKEKTELTAWIQGTVDAARRTDEDETGLLRNYLSDRSWFGEISGTALLAATVYRMAVLVPEVFAQKRDGYLSWADAKREAVTTRVDADGIAKPAVQPLDHLLRDPLMTGSPEGESFVLEMGAAWRDCVCSGVCPV